MDCRALGLLTPSFPFSQNLLSMYVASGTILGSEDAAVTKTGPFPACQSWEWRPGLFLTLHKGVGSHFQMSWWLGKLFHPPTFSAACAAPTSPPSSPLTHPYTSALSQHTTSPGLASKPSGRWGIFYPGTISHPVMDLQEIIISPQPAFSPCHVSWEKDYGWALHGEPSDCTGDVISLGLVAATCKILGMGMQARLR